VSLTPHDPPGSIDILLVNPAAGAGRAAKALPSLQKFAQEQNWNLEISVTKSAEHLAEKARCAAAKGHRRIFVLGGDGTFQVLLNAVFDYPDIVLGILPAGGGNDLAAALGLPGDPLRAAKLLLQSEPAPMDAVRVRTSEGRERLYVGGGGVGLDAEASSYAGGAFRNIPGRTRYLFSAIRALISFRPLGVRISLQPGESSMVIPKALLAAVMNTPSYGAGLYLAPAAQIDDGVLDLVLLERLTVCQIFALLPSLWAKGELKTSQVRLRRVNYLRIETDRSCSFQGDGEILGSTPVEISVVPRAFRILRPGNPGKF
jgi:diacylglycerol kinase (ATP)